MFKYSILGKDNRRKYPFTVCVTNYLDLAEYIVANGANALDPDGKQGLELYMQNRVAAEYLVPPSKDKTADDKENDNGNSTDPTPRAD